MALWRRERESETVHVTVDNVPFTPCGVDRDELGDFLWDAHEAASHVCGECSRALSAAAQDAEAKLRLVDARGADHARDLADAKAAMKHLSTLVPKGTNADRLIYGLACLARNDPHEAVVSVSMWVVEMRRIGVLRE